MERYAWRASVKPGKQAEYIERHNQIWPQMKAVLKEAGIVNYSIWLADGEVFGYYECEKGAAYAAKVQSESPVVDRWNEYMKDVMEMKKDEKTGAQPLLQEVFYLP
ncbi:MAG: L-rhamnose mutarotase [Clostridia bacterium]|nr:L-rhamnose mutarotase [Clostridia bacterium]